MSDTPDATPAPGPMEPPPPPAAPMGPESARQSFEPPPPPSPRAGASPPNLPLPPPTSAQGAPPGQATRQISPDGRWWWNGSEWVPMATPPPQARNRTTAGILAILLGDFGVHKFYLGNTGLGILYLAFCWTLIPGIIGLVEGIQYLTMSDEQFAWKFG
jgi:TM2 domain-containing membrane protein YozV